MEPIQPIGSRVERRQSANEANGYRSFVPVSFVPDFHRMPLGLA
jgi:hypothetical protein